MCLCITWLLVVVLAVRAFMCYVLFLCCLVVCGLLRLVSVSFTSYVWYVCYVFICLFRDV